MNSNRATELVVVSQVRALADYDYAHAENIAARRVCASRVNNSNVGTTSGVILVLEKIISQLNFIEEGVASGKRLEGVRIQG